MFNIGDRIMYPSVGVGVITEVVSRAFGSEKKEFFKVHVEEKNAQLMIPVDGFERIGVRPLVNSKTAKDLFRRFTKAPDAELFRTWSKKFRTYEDRIKTGDPFEIAEVLRDLLLQGKRKELSFGERKVLEQARSLLVRELAYSTDTAEEKVFKKVCANVDIAWEELPE